MPLSGIIPAQGAANVAVRFTAAAAGSFTLPFRCVIEHGETLPIALLAEVRRPVAAFQAPHVPFGSMPRGGALTTDIILNNSSATGPVNFKLGVTGPCGNRVEFEPAAGTIPAGGEAIIVATCHGDAAGAMMMLFANMYAPNARMHDTLLLLCRLLKPAMQTLILRAAYSRLRIRVYIPPPRRRVAVQH